MKHYVDYVKERSGADVITTDVGFVTYRIQGDECFLMEIYTAPEHRRSHRGAELVDAVALKGRSAGCKFISATISPQAGGSTEAMAAAIKVGFKLHSSGQNCVILTKEI